MPSGFQHQSHKEALKQVHITPAIAREQFDHDIDVRPDILLLRAAH